jgi:hypothetical protein
VGRPLHFRLAMLMASTVWLFFSSITTALSATTVSLSDRDVVLLPAAGQTEGSADTFIGQLILVAKELPARAEEPATPSCTSGAAETETSTPQLQAFCDVSGGSPFLQVGYVSEYLGQNGTEHRWSITASVTGISLASSSNRYAIASIGGRRYWLSIQYNTPAEKAATLQITQPSKRWLLSAEQNRVSLQVLSRGASTSRVTLVNSSLQDSETNERINVDAFMLCINTDCDGEVSVSGNKTTAVFLQANKASVPYGEFTGNLTFAADGIALSNNIEFTILSSGKDIKLLGVLLIAAGVIISWLITVFAPHQSQRLEQLRPAIVLRDSAAEWHKRVENVDALASIISDETRAALKQIIADLADEALKTRGYVPGRFPPATKSTLQPVETFQIYLKARSDRLNIIARVISTGMESLVSDWDQYKADQKLDEAKAALNQLDKLGTKAAMNMVDNLVSAVLAELDGVSNNVGRAMQSGRKAGAQLSSEELTTQLESINVGVWAIWVVITIVTGWAALILTNSGFGSMQDLFSCFGWGLGLQALGPQLSQLTTVKISQQVKFNVPG